MSGEDKGWLGAAARVTRVLLADPRVRRDIDTAFRHVDPDEAPALVRAVVWTDPGVTATALAVLPAVLNAGIESVRELGDQARRLPPALVHATADQLLSRLRFRRAGEATGHALALWVGWLRSRGSGPEDGWSAFAKGVADALREAGVDPAEALEVPLECMAARADRAVRHNPEAVARATETVRRVLQRHPDLAKALRGELAKEAE